MKEYTENSTYQKELNDIRDELLSRPDQCITFKELVERFDDIDAEYNHSPWNLLQIYSNFNILIGMTREEVIKVINNHLEHWKRLVREKICDETEGAETISAFEIAIKVLEQKPKIGYWIPTYGNVKCSICGNVKDSRDVGKATHYCDFCGAKMESR